MTDGDFPFRSFTMRSEGYDRGEVDSYVEELRGEITELRRALETATPRGDADARLHDPEGAVTRTLAIAQETADRVLHDAQVEADRRRVEADEHATTVVAEADERAARLLGDMEAQAAEVREQGVAAARSAIQVERDKAMAELAHVRRVRDDLRTEAVDLKAALDRYRSQAREASDTLAAAASGPLMSLELPDFIDDDVVLAGISSGTGDAADAADDEEASDAAEFEVDEVADADTPIMWEDDAVHAEASFDQGEATEAAEAAEYEDGSGEQVSYLRAVDDEVDEVVDSEGEDGDLADVIELEADDAAIEGDDDNGGTFLAEVRAAAVDDDVALAPEGDDSDRFLSELRGITDDADDDLDSEAAETFFDDDK